LHTIDKKNNTKIEKKLSVQKRLTETT
jgi:hypothetical protein